jgi:alkylresorcinol/alkylpyrone synthase
MLRNILDAQVPELAAESARTVLERVLARERLTHESIETWIWHSGGRKVIQAVQREMRLGGEDMRWSEQVLSDCGNVSSACVYFVMEAALRGGAAPGWWWMSSFGAGFSCHGALLDVRAA